MIGKEMEEMMVSRDVAAKETAGGMIRDKAEEQIAAVKEKHDHEVKPTGEKAAETLDAHLEERKEHQLDGYRQVIKTKAEAFFPNSGGFVSLIIDELKKKSDPVGVIENVREFIVSSEEQKILSEIDSHTISPLDRGNLVKFINELEELRNHARDNMETITEAI